MKKPWLKNFLLRRRLIFLFLFIMLFVTYISYLKITGLRSLTAKTKPVIVPAHTLPIANGDYGSIISEGIYKVPKDGFIKAFNPKLVNAPEYSIRYIAISNMSQKDPLCPSEYNRMYLMGTKLIEMKYPNDLGYPVKKDDKLYIRSAFVNPGEQDQKESHVEFKIDLAPPNSNLTPVTTAYLNVLPCHPLFFVPAKTKMEKSMPQPFIVPQKSRLVLAGVHTHNFAEHLILSKNGKELWKSIPERDSEGNNIKDSHYIDKVGIPLEKGDRLSISIRYNNPKSEETDAAGTLLIFLKPDN